MERFMHSPPTVESIHNLYQFSAVLNLNKSHVVDLALGKISQLEDAPGEVWNQSKYGQLMFIAPHLSERHRHHAMEIAKTVRGGYGKAVIKKLRRQFANDVLLCPYRYPAICY